jgi:hypothetical protein
MLEKTLYFVVAVKVNVDPLEINEKNNNLHLLNDDGRLSGPDLADIVGNLADYSVSLNARGIKIVKTCLNTVQLYPPT